MRIVLLAVSIAVSYSIGAGHLLKANSQSCQQYMANFKVTEMKEGKLATVTSPTVTFTPRQNAEVCVEDDARKIQIKVDSTKKPTIYLVRSNVTNAPTSKFPDIIAAPLVTVEVGQTATISFGDGLNIEVTIKDPARKS